MTSSLNTRFLVCTESKKRLNNNWKIAWGHRCFTGFSRRIPSLCFHLVVFFHLRNLMIVLFRFSHPTFSEFRSSIEIKCLAAAYYVQTPGCFANDNWCNQCNLCNSMEESFTYAPLRSTALDVSLITSQPLLLQAGCRWATGSGLHSSALP